MFHFVVGQALGRTSHTYYGLLILSRFHLIDDTLMLRNECLTCSLLFVCNNCHLFNLTITRNDRKKATAI